MKKREQFAVSLRKQKTNDIIQAKRKRTHTTFASNQENEDGTFYRGHPVFEEGNTSLDDMMRLLVPELYSPAAQNFGLVS